MVRDEAEQAGQGLESLLQSVGFMVRAVWTPSGFL